MLAMKIDMTDFDRKFALLLEMPRTIEKAIVGAMTETVKEVHAAQIQEMKLSLHMPTPWIQRGLKMSLPYGKNFMGKSARYGQTLADSGTFFEEGPTGRNPSGVIRPHIEGGPRKLKASEYRIQSVSRGAGPYTIMGRNYPKNMYGNIPASVYSRMVSDLGAVPTAMPKAENNQAKAAKFFLMKREDGQEFIAERIGKNDLRTVLIFTNNAPNYKKRYDYYGVGREQVAYSLPRHFDRILMRYMNRL